MTEPDPAALLSRHQHAQHLLNAAANLCGTCLAGAALIRVESAQTGRSFLADNVLATSALCFLVATVLAYVALRQRSGRCHLATEIAFGLGATLLAAGLVSLALEIGLV